MFAGFYSAATAIQSSELHQEALAQNLANINVPGYRRVSTAFSVAEATPDATDQATNQVGTRPRMAIDFAPGMVQRTDRALDVALDGDGFLVIDTPAGPLYTRDGVMNIDADGRLVNNAGFPFQGVNAVPPNVTPSEIMVGLDGQVSFQGQALGQLQIVQFADNNSLVAAGPTLFAEGDVAAEPATNVQVHQGSRELSNVSATDELVRMMIGMRHHEAAQKALNSMSDALREHTSGGN